MSDLKSEGALFRYYCTAGNGMERFLMDEVKVKLSAEDVCHMPGKVLFSSSAGINRVSELKAAERLFLLLRQDAPVRLSAHTSPAKAASVLQSRLLGDADQWRKAVMTWSRLQGELAGRRSTVKAPSTARTVTWKREEGNKHDVESRKSTEGQNEESGDGRLRSNEQNGEYIPENKKKTEKELQEVRYVERKRKRDDDEEEEKEEERRGADFNCRDDATQILDHNMESSRRTMDNLAQDFSQSVENAKTSEEGDKTLIKTSRIKPEPSSVPVSFRISCKCTGSLSRCFSTQEVNKVIGVGLSRLLGWRADLKNPLLEVHVYLSDDHCLLGIPLTRLPLANRSYIKTTGLRSTVAWAMASLAQIQPGFCVVDPMCGVGTILIEAAQEHKAACFLGMDIDDGQLQRANENVEFAELENRIYLLKASSMALPLPSASVDAVVCDLPFGRKFGTKTNMATNLPLILTEMERVLRTGGILVLLLSPQLSCQLKKLLAQTDTGRTTNPETKPQTGIQDSPSPSLPSTQQQAFQTHQEVKSPPTQKTHPPLPLSSLKHQASHRVSLGVIDGLIHKYVKMDT